MRSIAISAGEASGDLNGAALALELKKLRPDLRIWGAGGAKMRDAGVETVVDTAGGGTISISENLKAAPRIAASYYGLRRALLARRPDIFVPIDYGAFNIRLARLARKRGIPVVYYFPPSSWRKRPGNAGNLLACGGKVVTPFPWSADFLTSKGVDARFVGHPLLDIVKPSRERSEFLRRLDLAETLPLIGLLPGSRAHELAAHIPLMMDCARIISRELGGAQFVVGAAGGSDKIQLRIDAIVRTMPNAPIIRVAEGLTYECISYSDLLITKSGTATLEAAILGTPMVIVYKGTSLMRFEFLFRKSVLEGYIGMPNIIAGREVCPELINTDASAEVVSSIAIGLLKDKDSRDAMRASLGEIRDQLGEPGAVERAARAVLEIGGLA